MEFILTNCQFSMISLLVDLDFFPAKVGKAVSHMMHRSDFRLRSEFPSQLTLYRELTYRSDKLY